VIGLLESLARPVLRMLDPEDAHRIAIHALKLPPFAKLVADDPRLAVRAFGLNFPNPVGMAAGFDKHAEVAHALLKLGFGFVEVGTVTPLPQSGNLRPRVFRLNRDEGVINRLGFNRESADRIADYVRLIETFAPVASYFSVNISSPNTPGLRELQQAKMLDHLLALVVETRMRMSRVAGPTPLLVKIAPDLTLGELDDIVGAARRHRVDGMIIGNTTLARPLTLRDQAMAGERGGLSGRPLFPLATRMLAETYVRVEGAFPLIGVGGIDSGQAAVLKIRAGASLIELYSALVFHGLRLVAAIKSELSEVLRRAGQARIDELVGADAAAMTAEKWPA